MDVEMRATRNFRIAATRQYVRPGDYFTTDASTATEYENRGMAERAEKAAPVPANKARQPAANKAVAPANPPDAGEAPRSSSSPAARASSPTTSAGLKPGASKPAPAKKK